MKKQGKATLALLFFVLVAALALRFYNLGEAHSLHQDEAVNGVDAYSILLTGSDHWGNFLPVLFREFGMYNNQLQVYLTVPFVALLGLNEFSTRAPWALLGALLVLPAFAVGRELGGDKTGLLAAAFVAVSPWMLFTSRMALASNLAHVFTAAAGACFFIAVRKPKLLPASAFFFGLAANTYGIALAFIPIFLSGAALLFKSFLLLQKNRGTVLFSIALLAAMLAPLAATHLSNPQTNNYFNALTVLNENNWANGKQYAPPHEWLAAGIMAYMNPFFWFSGFDKINFDNYGFNGFLPFWMIPFFALGALACANRVKDDERYLLLFWWIVAAGIAAALFIPAPNARHFNIASPAFESIAAVGAAFAVSLAAKRGGKSKAALFLLVAVALWAFVSTAFFLEYLYTAAPLEANKFAYFGFGWRQAVDFVQAHPEFDAVIATNRSKSSTLPYIYFLFYAKSPPREFQAQPHSKHVTASNWVKVTAIGEHVFFCNPNDCGDAARAKKPLYVLGSTVLPELKTIKVFSDETGFSFLRLAEKPG